MENAPKKILLVEDDKGISDFIDSELKHEGYTTVTAGTGRQALEVYETENPDLIILDIMLPELNGLEVLRRIREKSTVPVIIETARGDSIDKINGLNLGADDYIAKPFEIEELLARINALLRRIKFEKASEDALKHKELELNPSKMNCSICGKEISLSKTEFMMLKCFVENKDKALTRSDIIDSIWGKGHFIDENTVDVYVGYLRNKISTCTNDEYIKTVRGLGYMMI